MDEWPKLYHPARYEDLAYVVDTAIVVQGYQLRPDTWVGLASWCGGERILDDDGNQALQLGTLLAHLGDFVMLRDDVFQVEPADGHYQRWSPVGEQQ